jgi:hypothetical protein
MTYVTVVHIGSQPLSVAKHPQLSTDVAAGMYVSIPSIAAATDSHESRRH